jgi:hypothetical protein
MNLVRSTDEDLERKRAELEKLPATNQAAPITVALAVSYIDEIQQHREAVKKLLPYRQNQQVLADANTAQD